MTRIQRAVLSALREHTDGLTAAQLADLLWPCPSPARHETLRLALGGLQRSGLADVFAVGPGADLAASITAAGWRAASR